MNPLDFLALTAAYEGRGDFWRDALRAAGWCDNVAAAWAHVMGGKLYHCEWA